MELGLWGRGGVLGGQLSEGDGVDYERGDVGSTVD